MTALEWGWQIVLVLVLGLLGLCAALGLATVVLLLRLADLLAARGRPAEETKPRLPA